MESELIQGIIEQNLASSLFLAGLGVAFLFGVGHALEPGHGKTTVTAYLVGYRATFKQALFLGLVTTIAHTASIFALGLLALLASQYIVIEQLYPILGFVSGFSVCIVGSYLLTSRIRNNSQHHHHYVKEVINLNTLIAIGIPGGIAPCPSALILLLSAVALHKLVYGILLIAAFSFGIGFSLSNFRTYSYIHSSMARSFSFCGEVAKLT